MHHDFLTIQRHFVCGQMYLLQNVCQLFICDESISKVDHLQFVHSCCKN